MPNVICLYCEMENPGNSNGYYCKTQCKNQTYRIIESKLSPWRKGSRYLRGILLEYLDEGSIWKELDTLDSNDERKIEWMEACMERLSVVMNGRDKAEVLIREYYDVYKDYFDDVRS